MEAQQAIDLGRQAIMIALWVGAPILLAGMVVGLVIGLLQALTPWRRSSCLCKVNFRTLICVVISTLVVRKNFLFT
jgi:flagellar biosynthetic protein FliQ